MSGQVYWVGLRAWLWAKIVGIVFISLSVCEPPSSQTLFCFVCIVYRFSCPTHSQDRGFRLEAETVELSGKSSDERSRLCVFVLAPGSFYRHTQTNTEN